MENILKSLNLSKEELEIFNNSFGKTPYTLEEISDNHPNIHPDKIPEIIDNLIDQKLFLNIVPEGSNLVPRYIALPPLNAIYKTVIASGEYSEKVDEEKSGINLLVLDILKASNNAVGIDSIINEINMLKNNFENESSDIRNEVQEIMNEMQTRDDSSFFYTNFEDTLKKDIHAYFASVLEIILQMDNESEDTSDLDFMNTEQWNQLKTFLKTFLAKFVHERSIELDAHISGNFTELKNFFASKLAVTKEEQFGQNVVNLGILKIVIEKLDSLLEKLSNKKKSIEETSEIQKELSGRIDFELKNINQKIIENLKYIEDILPNTIKNYFNIDDYWYISNEASIKEEIANIIQNQAEEITIIVPNINHYLPIETLKDRSGKAKLNLFASDAHDSDITAMIKTFPSIHYLRIEKNKAIVIKGESRLVIGISGLEGGDIGIKTRAFGIKSQELIDLLNPVVEQLKSQGKLPPRKQVNNNFNLIIENIHSYNGDQIRSLLQENLDVLSKLKGISLKLLELKLLTSKLKGIKTVLNEELKKGLIEKIKTWNEELTGLPLMDVPEITKTQKEEEIQVQILDLGIEPSRPFEEAENFGFFDKEKIEPLFDILLEVIDKAKGSELSEQIQNAINTLIQIQGYGIITTWKEELGKEENAEKILEIPFQEKLRHDLRQWKEAILDSIGTSSKKSFEHKTIEKEKIKEEIDLGDYVSPGLMQSQDELTPEQEADISLSEESPKRSNKELLKDYFEKLLTQVEILSGIEISNILQDLGDALVEEHGYMATKEVRPLISKVKIFRGPIEEDIKQVFLEEITNLKQKYIGEEEDDLLGDYQPSFATMDEEPEPISPPENVDDEGGSELSTLFSKVLEDILSLEGYKLTDNLQEIADIIMQTKGALSARSIRPWISKLRAIRDPVDEETKTQFIDEFSKLKEKFSE